MTSFSLLCSSRTPLGALRSEFAIKPIGNITAKAMRYRQNRNVVLDNLSVRVAVFASQTRYCHGHFSTLALDGDFDADNLGHYLFAG